MARFYSFFDQLLFFWFVLVWKCKYLTRKIIFACFCPKYGIFLQKNLNCLTENVEIFLTCRWSPALKKTRKRFFSQWSNSLWKLNLKYPNICFDFYEFRYLRWPFWKNCSTRPQNFGGLKEKSKKKAWSYVKFCISSQLVLQICKESETEPKF